MTRVEIVRMLRDRFDDVGAKVEMEEQIAQAIQDKFESKIKELEKALAD